LSVAEQRLREFDLSLALMAGEVGASKTVDVFVDPDPIRWIENHFHIPELKGPLQLDDYQKKALREALSSKEGVFDYSIILWSDIKKSIKSTLAAAVILWRAFQVDDESGWGSFYIIANDLKQADSRVFYYLRRAIELNPAMKAVCSVRTGSYKVTLPKQTFIEAIPIDPTGEAGSNADGLVFSELWGAHGKAMSQMWAEMTLSPTKFGKSFRWIETYAGYKDKSEILWSLYEQGVKKEYRIDDDLEMFAINRLFVLWNTVPRLSWQTPEYYSQERVTLASMPEEFDRVHRNQWSEGGTDRFLPSITLWDNCEQELPTLSKSTPLVLALDGAYSGKGDTFGAVAVGRHPSYPDCFAVRAVMAWEAKGEPRDFEQIQDDIKNFCLNWNVVEVTYDPRELIQMAQHLSKSSKTKDGKPFRGVSTVEFHQGADRETADKLLLDSITSRKVFHGGDSRLRSHLDNADRKTTDDGKRLRIVKRTGRLKIDLAVCASMACARALNLPLTSIAVPDGTEQISTWSL
jgi:hypothetical protein